MMITAERPITTIDRVGRRRGVTRAVTAEEQERIEAGQQELDDFFRTAAIDLSGKEARFKEHLFAFQGYSAALPERRVRSTDANRDGKKTFWRANVLTAVQSLLYGMTDEEQKALSDEALYGVFEYQTSHQKRNPAQDEGAELVWTDPQDVYDILKLLQLLGLDMSKQFAEFKGTVVNYKRIQKAEKAEVQRQKNIVAGTEELVTHILSIARPRIQVLEPDVQEDLKYMSPEQLVHGLLSDVFLNLFVERKDELSEYELEVIAYYFGLFYSNVSIEQYPTAEQVQRSLMFLKKIEPVDDVTTIPTRPTYTSTGS